MFYRGFEISGGSEYDTGTAWVSAKTENGLLYLYKTDLPYEISPKVFFDDMKLMIDELIRFLTIEVKNIGYYNYYFCRRYIDSVKYNITKIYSWRSIAERLFQCPDVTDLDVDRHIDMSFDSISVPMLNADNKLELKETKRFNEFYHDDKSYTRIHGKYKGVPFTVNFQEVGSYDVCLIEPEIVHIKEINRDNPLCSIIFSEKVSADKRREFAFDLAKICKIFSATEFVLNLKS